jgi:hypothetical protein
VPKNNLMDKIKEGVSVQEVEDFARKHTAEVFTVLAILIGTVSSTYDFFTSAGLSILFLAIGIGLGIFFPSPIDRGLKQYYGFSVKQEKLTQLILGIVSIVVAIFVPFVIFGVVGLLAGTSYHYYTRNAQMTDHKTGKQSRRNTGDEHD